jgi:hypothetical protein
MPLPCFTCGAQLDHEDGYLSERREGLLLVIPVCDDCRIRHAREGSVRTGYLIEDRVAHGLTSVGQGYRA